MKKVGGILWGVVITAVGVILALNALGITSINFFFSGWWTLFIIVPCAIGLFTDHDKWGSVIGLCIGVVLLLGCRHVIDLSSAWKLLLPAVIVIIGVRLIFRNIIPDHGAKLWGAMKADGEELRSGTATFSGTNLDFSVEVFRGAELNAVFGGVKCDLRGAIIEQDCVINASAIFGGIDILVPEGLNVKLRSTSIFGGASDKAAEKRRDGAHTLYINATCIFGGLEVK